MGVDLKHADEVGEIVSGRIDVLVREGRLEAAGQIKNWRFSEVLLTPET